MKINLHSNAQLFDERSWNALGLACARVRNLEISIETAYAAQADTYAIMRRGSFDRIPTGGAAWR